MAALVVQCPEGAATSAVLHLVATTEQRATCAVRFKPFGGGPSHEVAFTVADTYEQRGPWRDAGLVLLSEHLGAVGGRDEDW